MAGGPIDPGVDGGHVHLKVADIERALRFWRDVLGFEEQARYGDQAVFISAGGYHHHIGLNTWEQGRLASCARNYGPPSERDLGLLRGRGGRDLKPGLRSDEFCSAPKEERARRFIALVK